MKAWMPYNLGPGDDLPRAHRAFAALDELVSLLQEATEIMRYTTMNVASGDHAADIETLTADFLVKIGQN